jgi:hypothetical protein
MLASGTEVGDGSGWWQAPDAVFAGKNLADLEATLASLQQANEDLAIKTQVRSAALKVRDEQMAAMVLLLSVIVRGVQGHADYGEDSPLYRAMGFVPKSERRSGLTRRSTPETGGNAGNEQAAA